MNLKTLPAEKRLVRHRTSKNEVAGLLAIADRKFATAYNAVLQLATILLYVSGYRSKGTGHHYTTFMTMPDILGPAGGDLSDYFNACRAKRNITDYTASGLITKSEAGELIKEAVKFHSLVKNWLKEHYPALI